MIKKLYYRLSEVAQDWGCSLDDLFKYGEAGRLTISVEPDFDARIRGFGFFYSSLTHCKRKQEFKDTRLIRFYDPELEPFPDHLFPICADALTWIRYHLKHKTREPFSFSTPSNLKDIEFWSGSFYLKDMFITHEEKARFERELTKAECPPLAQKTEETVSRILGVILELVTGKEGKAFKTRDELQEAMIKHFGSLPGISKSSLKNYFSSATKKTERV